MFDIAWFDKYDLSVLCLYFVNRYKSIDLYAVMIRKIFLNFDSNETCWKTLLMTEAVDLQSKSMDWFLMITASVMKELHTKWKDCKSRKNLCTKYFRYTKKCYAYEIDAVNLSTIFLLKNAKKTCKPNNCGVNCNWMKNK